jgi:hypothetical protein
MEVDAGVQRPASGPREVLRAAVNSKKTMSRFQSPAGIAERGEETCWEDGRCGYHYLTPDVL